MQKRCQDSDNYFNSVATWGANWGQQQIKQKP